MGRSFVRHVAVKNIAKVLLLLVGGLFIVVGGQTAGQTTDISEPCKAEILKEFDNDQPGQMCGENTRGQANGANGRFTNDCRDDGPSQNGNGPFTCLLCDSGSGVRFFVNLEGQEAPCTPDEIKSFARILDEALVESGQCDVDRQPGQVTELCRNSGRLSLAPAEPPVLVPPPPPVGVPPPPPVGVPPPPPVGVPPPPPVGVPPPPPVGVPPPPPVVVLPPPPVVVPPPPVVVQPPPPAPPSPSSGKKSKNKNRSKRCRRMHRRCLYGRSNFNCCRKFCKCRGGDWRRVRRCVRSCGRFKRNRRNRRRRTENHYY